MSQDLEHMDLEQTDFGQTDFEQTVASHRRELLAHCYRMLGSAPDAEDAVQETMLRAWRSFGVFDPRRASARTWLYRIATNVCLSALGRRGGRSLPARIVEPSTDPGEPFARGDNMRWVEPFPDASGSGIGQDPADASAARGSLRLAFVAAIQYLPPRQRAVLILRDVLQFSAAETAEILDATPVAVNSALQRAHARMAQVAVVEDDVAEPATVADRAVIERYITAFENSDIAALTLLLTDDVVLEMPPMLNWFHGRANYGLFIERVCRMRGPRWHLVQTSANGQPAVGAYVLDSDGVFRAHSIQVFSVFDGLIGHNVVYQNTELFGLFGLSDTASVA
jgi:RNA polymerase sigma-70 factor (ECF subfamily)